MSGQVGVFKRLLFVLNSEKVRVVVLRVYRNCIPIYQIPHRTRSENGSPWTSRVSVDVSKTPRGRRIASKSRHVSASQGRVRSCLTPTLRNHRNKILLYVNGEEMKGGSSTDRLESSSDRRPRSSGGTSCSRSTRWTWAPYSSNTPSNSSGGVHSGPDVVSPVSTKHRIPVVLVHVSPGWTGPDRSRSEDRVTE